MKTFLTMLSYKRLLLLSVLSSFLMILTLGLINSEAKAQASTFYIPSLNAKVISLRFFEGPYDSLPRRQRVYGTVFQKSRTRYIFWELKLEFIPPGRRIDFAIEESWYGPGNKLIAIQNFQASVEPEWSGSYFYHGYGWKEPGKWSAGIYRLDLSIDGVRAVSNSFEIYEAKTPEKKKEERRTIILGEADKVKEYRKKADLYLERGDMENYKLTLSSLANAYSARCANRYVSGDLRGALEDCNEALRIKPGPSNTYVIRGHTKFKLGDFQGAIEDYRQAILIEPDNAVAYHYRGIARLGERDSGGFDDLEIAAALYKHEGNEEGYRKVREITKKLRR